MWGITKYFLQPRKKYITYKTHGRDCKTVSGWRGLTRLDFSLSLQCTSWSAPKDICGSQVQKKQKDIVLHAACTWAMEHFFQRILQSPTFTSAQATLGVDVCWRLITEQLAQKQVSQLYMVGGQGSLWRKYHMCLHVLTHFLRHRALLDVGYWASQTFHSCSFFFFSDTVK